MNTTKSYNYLTYHELKILQHINHIIHSKCQKHQRLQFLYVLAWSSNSQANNQLYIPKHY